MARVIAGTPPERTSRLMIVAAVLFAAIAAVLIFVALQNRGGDEGSAALTADVVVAARNIPANTKLSADMLEVRTLSADATLSNAYASSEPLVGLPTRFPIAKGEQLTPLKVGLDAIEDENDLALVLKKGQRGFAVEATEVTAVGGLLLPGNFVDVIAVFDEETGGVPKAITVLQSIEVLSVAQEAQQPVPAVGTDTEETEATDMGQGLRSQRPDEVERQPGARSVTLAVTPEQAQLLAVLQVEDAKIWLALRPLDDNEGVPLNETNLLRFHSPPLPEP